MHNIQWHTFDGGFPARVHNFDGQCYCDTSLAPSIKHSLHKDEVFDSIEMAFIGAMVNMRNIHRKTFLMHGHRGYVTRADSGRPRFMDSKIMQKYRILKNIDGNSLHQKWREILYFNIERICGAYTYRKWTKKEEEEE